VTEPWTDYEEDDMSRRRMTFVAALMAAVAAVVIGAALAAHHRVPLSSVTEAKVRKAIVGFELAGASTRPAGMVGKQLTPEDKALLQARFLRRIERYATGPELRQWQSWDYPGALLEDEWDTRELTGCRGKIVYWDFRRRNPDGSLFVRAGVEQHYSVVTWDAKTGTAVPRPDWVTGVSVKDYVLKKSGSLWKVYSSEHWMFYDPVARQLETGP
jgi:hypothetical protein